LPAIRNSGDADVIVLTPTVREPVAGFDTATGELAWAVELLLDPEADLLHGSVLYLDAGGHRGIH